MHEIFVTFTPSKEFTSQMGKLLRKRSRTGRNLKVLAVLTLGYAVWSEMQRREQNEKIEQLASRIEELERDKEE